MNNPVSWFEIHVQDMNRAKAFYQAVFDAPLSKLHNTEFEMWAFTMRQGAFGATGALVKTDTAPSDGRGVVVYFSCDDCAVEAERAQKAGGRIERAKKSIGDYGCIAMIVDTEGNQVGLHSMN